MAARVRVAAPTKLPSASRSPPSWAVTSGAVVSGSGCSAATVTVTSAASEVLPAVSVARYRTVCAPGR